MITQDQYNQLIDKIVEAVPEIMELKFGCIIELEGSNPLMIISENQSPFVVLDGQTIFPVEYDSGYKIHGRPIQLADVLRAAMGKLMIDGYGVFHEDQGQHGEHGVYEDEPTWDLSLPLDQQSDETKELLYNLIVRNG